ncbi:MAG: hypothetical protein OEM82_06000 [Acidobacteriota bacterium]|nr:hypothetical protein [Acidobacteriota bacterium]MDH3529682.1 hypothetical protein [Acidobacteriota bacterium]
MNKAVELTENTAKVTLTGAVQTAEMTENMIEGLYKVGYDANVDALKVAKGYWDATSEIRRDWIKLFESTGETFIEQTTKMEFPFQKEAVDFGKGMFDNISKTFSGFIPQAKSSR